MGSRNSEKNPPPKKHSKIKRLPSVQKRRFSTTQNLAVLNMTYFQESKDTYRIICIHIRLLVFFHLTFDPITWQITALPISFDVKCAKEKGRMKIISTKTFVIQQKTIHLAHLLLHEKTNRKNYNARMESLFSCIYFCSDHIRHPLLREKRK